VWVVAVMAVGFLAGAGLAQDTDKTRSDAKQPEAETAVKARIGEKAPDFLLTDTEGNEHRLSDYLEENKCVILEWFNPVCPFVKKHHQATRSMAETYAVAEENDMVWLAINSGAPGKQGHGLETNKKARKDFDMAYPLLLDESGEVGRLYGAKTTPHMFLIDNEGILLYAGAIDNAPDTKKLGDINYVRNAVAACLAGEKNETATTKPYGCSVKYAGPAKLSDSKKAGAGT
jgi:peroxiredoxin